MDGIFANKFSVRGRSHQFGVSSVLTAEKKMGKASKCQLFNFNIVGIFHLGIDKSFLLDIFRKQDFNFVFEWSFPFKIDWK